MDLKMPRGAIPTPRSELAGSVPYRPDSSTDVFIPTGEFPTSNQELAAAQPYKAAGTSPESHLAWPKEIAFWDKDTGVSSIWAEEAFAKSCSEPRTFIPIDVVQATARKCGSSNFAKFMQVHGFQMHDTKYLDGPFYSINWSDQESLNSAIATNGPVKIGVASASLDKITPGKGGWTIYGLPPDRSEDHCASLCGYGQLTMLVHLFEQQGIKVNLPSGMPPGLCYALFTWGSVGIIDQQSMMNITGEAWVRNPTTIVKSSVTK
jgi:hypothetical protein